MTARDSGFSKSEYYLISLNHVNDQICRTFPDCLLTVKINRLLLNMVLFQGHLGTVVNMRSASLPHCRCGVRGTSSPQTARQCGESVSLNCSTADRQRASFNIQPRCLPTLPRRAHCRRSPRRAATPRRAPEAESSVRRSRRLSVGAEIARRRRCEWMASNLGVSAGVFEVARARRPSRSG